MYGELSDDDCHINMPFEDVHRLVTTMRIAELILNDRVQTKRKEKMAEITASLDAEHCPNMSALLAELEKARYALMQKHSFQSIEAFDAEVYDLEGLILFDTMLIARAVDWLATLSINLNTEIRRGMSFTSIITITRSFLKQGFVAPCPKWENGSRKWLSLPRAV
jgi:hypothetical protein